MNENRWVYSLSSTYRYEIVHYVDLPFASEDDPFFPSDEIVPQARERLSTLVHVERLANEKHILLPAAQRQVIQSIREFFRE